MHLGHKLKSTTVKQTAIILSKKTNSHYTFKESNLTPSFTTSCYVKLGLRNSLKKKKKVKIYRKKKTINILLSRHPFYIRYVTYAPVTHALQCHVVNSVFGILIHQQH